MLKKKNIITTVFLLLVTANLFPEDKIRVTGSIQSDILLPQSDSIIGAAAYNEFALTNTYADVKVIGKIINAGLRFEYLKHPLPGFERDFEGLGFPNIYLNANFKKIQITAGDFYEQFGNGLILRSYEERSLGIDNSLRGLKLVVQPFTGINLKLIGGFQRRHFEWNTGGVYGADVELNIEQWLKKLKETSTFWSVGASFVSKRQTGDTILVNPAYRLNLPDYVGSYAVRTKFQSGNINLLAEYAYKFNDPAKDNGYIYKDGSVLLLSGSWSKKGMSVLLQAKRSDNMSFRSDRNQTGLSSFINHLPPFTLQHSYTLAALYPYATQPDGEWAFQGELAYLFKRKSMLGGKYGTKVKLNYSHVRSIQKDFVSDNPAALMGTVGYHSDFLKLGNDLYYNDLNFSVEKKLTADLKFNLMYMNQKYNQLVVEAHGEMITSNIFISEINYKINSTLNVRTELQYLQTKQGEGDWLYGSVELSVLPSVLISVSDQYNIGTTDIHYYAANATYMINSHRIMLGFGRTRAGYNCAGGVCRYVPASKGFTISYNYNF